MFDLGASELLLIMIVAVIVIGPKDMPLALRTAGRWIGKIRRLSGHFRSGLDAMIREAEMEEMEKKWKAQNEKIMQQDPAGLPAETEPTGALPAKPRLAEGAATEHHAPAQAIAVSADPVGESGGPVPADHAPDTRHDGLARAGDAEADAASPSSVPSPRS